MKGCLLCSRGVGELSWLFKDTLYGLSLYMEGQALVDDGFTYGKEFFLKWDTFGIAQLYVDSTSTR